MVNEILFTSLSLQYASVKLIAGCIDVLYLQTFPDDGVALNYPKIAALLKTASKLFVYVHLHLANPQFTIPIFTYN